MQPNIPIKNIEMVRVVDLRPADYNPRRTTEKEAKDIRASIESLGFIDPIIVNKHEGRENIIVGGHQRYYVAKDLGWDTVPCVFVDYDEQKEKEANLRLNKNVGGWDWEALTAFDPNFLRDVGFGELELVEHFQLDDMEVEEDGFDPEEALPEETNIQVGDIFKLGDHRLMCGDATNQEQVATLMGENKVDMVFTDPPYNVDYKGGSQLGESEQRQGILNDKMSSQAFYEFLKKVIGNMMAYNEGAFYIFMSSTELINLKKAFEDAGGHFQNIIVWAKNTFTLGRSDYHHQIEPALYGWKDGVINHYFIGTRKEGNIWEPLKSPIVKYEDGYTIIKMGEKWLKLQGRVEGEICDKEGQTDLWKEDKPSKSKEHPTMKPLKLVSRAIRNSSLPHGNVMDLFGGSGSTLMACETMARKCFTMELDPKYVNVIIKRWESHTGQKAVKVNSF